VPRCHLPGDVKQTYTNSGTVGDWREYDFDEVVGEIRKRAKIKDIKGDRRKC